MVLKAAVGIVEAEKAAVVKATVEVAKMSLTALAVAKICGGCSGTQVRQCLWRLGG